MTDSGYNVFWNEPKLDGTPTGDAQRRHFVSKERADEFASSLPESTRPRVYPAKQEPVDALDFWLIERDRQTAGRDNTDVLNRRRLVELMGIHNITLPAKQFDKWRPTEEKTGHIEGIAGGLTCIMTDGLQGYFTREGREPLIGHVDWFKWDVPNISYIPYITPEGEKRFFKQVTDSGAPPAWAKRPARAIETTEPRARKVKAHSPMTTQAALALIERMTNGAMK